MGLVRLNGLQNNPKDMNLGDLVGRRELAEDGSEVKEGTGRLVGMHYTHL